METQALPLGRGRPFFPFVAVKRVFWFFKTQPLGAVGGLLLLILVLVAILAPMLATHNPVAQDSTDRLRSPSMQHFLGTDQAGRDVYSRLVYGSRISLYVGIVSVIVGVVVGLIVGFATAYFRGTVDLLVQRVVDVLMGFPGLVLAMVFVAALGASLNNVVLAIAVVFAPKVARIARSSALTIRGSDYVLAAEALGASGLRILVRHLAPNSVTPVIVLATGYLGTAIVTEASLSFLGLGVPPPHASWGRMLDGAREYMSTAPWLVLAPGVAITLTVFGFNLFGDALRDVLDPRLKGR